VRRISLLSSNKKSQTDINSTFKHILKLPEILKEKNKDKKNIKDKENKEIKNIKETMI
jgi:hypothetical protein